jgi:endonuclease YncB( thermonuclease family)
MRWMLLTALLVPASALADPCTAPLPPPGTSFSGTVRYVGDGDSICVGNGASGSTWIEVRVADFYAPELHAAGGPQANCDTILDRSAA